MTAPAAFLAGLLLAAAPAPPAPWIGADRVEAAALARYAWSALRGDPSASVEDAYKWLFQAARGGEHAVASEASARAWLEEEWAALGPPRPGERLVEPLRPDGLVVRVHLRPFRAAGGDREALLAAFLESARLFRPDRSLFVASWRELGTLLPDRPGAPMTRADFAALDRAAEAAGWPAGRHGPGFERAHAPAYRVLTGEAAERLVRGLGKQR